MAKGPGTILADLQSSGIVNPNPGLFGAALFQSGGYSGIEDALSAAKEFLSGGGAKPAVKAAANAAPQGQTPSASSQAFADPVQELGAAGSPAATAGPGISSDPYAGIPGASLVSGLNSLVGLAVPSAAAFTGPIGMAMTGIQGFAAAMNAIAGALSAMGMSTQQGGLQALNTSFGPDVLAGLSQTNSVVSATDALNAAIAAAQQSGWANVPAGSEALVSGFANAYATGPNSYGLAGFGPGTGRGAGTGNPTPGTTDFGAKSDSPSDPADPGTPGPSDTPGGQAGAETGGGSAGGDGGVGGGGSGGDGSDG